MAAARGERVYHQDYIARIRYSNALPPPPTPPKLLDIPNNALEQYTSPGFASRMAREQPLNIEADSELGMPIDLIGIPGVFEGNERALWGHEHPPPPHLHDRPLLRSLNALQKGAAASAGVSFLRRTEYISGSDARSRSDPSLAKPDLKRKRPSSTPGAPREDDPIRMVRDIVKGFDIAYPHDAAKGEETTTNVRGSASTAEERRAWAQPRHPNDPTLQLVDAYPILPDFDLPDIAYHMIKYSTNPVATQDVYDERLDVAILKPLPLDPEKVTEREAQQVAHEADNSVPPPGPVEYDYDFYMLDEKNLVDNVQRKLDQKDPSRDDEELYGGGRDNFKFKRIRGYETQKIGANAIEDNPYDEWIAVGLHDPPDEKTNGATSGQTVHQEKAAYIYGITVRSQIRPKRKGGVGLGPGGQGDENTVHEIDVRVTDPDDDTRARRAAVAQETFGEGFGSEGRTVVDSVEGTA